MERPNAIAALKGKRGEIAGRVEALQDQLRQALIDLDHVDCTILIFDPDAELSEIKPKPLPPRHHAFKGQVTRAILDMLRDAAEPLDGKAITLRLMVERELNSADKKLVKTIQKRVGAALRNMRDRGLVASAPGKAGLGVGAHTVIERPADSDVVEVRANCLDLARKGRSFSRRFTKAGGEWLLAEDQPEDE